MKTGARSLLSDNACAGRRRGHSNRRNRRASQRLVDGRLPHAS